MPASSQGRTLPLLLQLALLSLEGLSEHSLIYHRQNLFIAEMDM